MLRSLTISPIVALSLAFASALALAASPLLFGLLAAILIAVMALVDGRLQTAAALSAGWAIAAGGALSSLYLGSLELPVGVESMAGLAFVVLPTLLAVLTFATALAFAAAHLVRQRTRLSTPETSDGDAS